MGHGGQTTAGIDPGRAAAFRAAEARRYAEARPISERLAREGAAGFLDGVPMHWMLDWPMPFPFTVAGAKGARLRDVDGNELADFCLGDTGSMFGHAPEPVVRAIREQAGNGLTFMLPTEAAWAVQQLLVETFGLPLWQVATTATDANRFALRVARAATGRDKVLVFNGCYHGSVEETFVRLRDGQPIHRPGLLGQSVDLTANTRIVEFNDLPALEVALASGDVACVITEPVLTNCCMVLPDPGFHEALRRLTRVSGTLLLIDETHTISTGPGGYARTHGLEPDLFVLGKPVAGGVPASIWGMTHEVAERLAAARQAVEPGYSGMGTTLSANAMQLAAMRACLSEVMTPANYAHMERLAGRLADGLSGVITRLGLPWHVVRVGSRIEFIFSPQPLRNGGEAEALHLSWLEGAIHLGLLNRGVLIAPFHNMMLTSPATSDQDVDRLIDAFDAVATALSGEPN